MASLSGAVAPRRYRDVDGPRQRAERRLKVFCVLDVERDGDRLRGHLLNISPVGGMLHVRGLTADRLSLHFSSLNCALEARVVWQTGAYAGVRFLRTLRPPELETLVAPLRSQG